MDLISERHPVDVLNNADAAEAVNHVKYASAFFMCSCAGYFKNRRKTAIRIDSCNKQSKQLRRISQRTNMKKGRGH